MQNKNHKKPLVSVLIPLYNAEKYFNECMQSIINQTYKNIEVIIVDDGSTDNSLSIAKKYEKEYHNIKVYTQNNIGASAARNRAYTISKGDYIQYFDADDIMDKNKIYFQIEEMEKYKFSPEISCIGKWYKFFNKISNKKDQQLSTYRTYDDPLKYLSECWRKSQCMIGTAWLIPREIHEKVGKWEESLSVHDDYLFFAKCEKKKKKIVFADKSIVYWRQDNKKSLSKNYSYEGMKSHLMVCQKLQELVKNKYHLYDTRESLAIEYSKFIYRAYPKYRELIEIAEQSLKDLGYEKPLPLPSRKFQITSKILGFYLAAKLFKLKEKLWGLKAKYGR